MDNLEEKYVLRRKNGKFFRNVVTGEDSTDSWVLSRTFDDYDVAVKFAIEWDLDLYMIQINEIDFRSYQSFKETGMV